MSEVEITEDIPSPEGPQRGTGIVNALLVAPSAGLGGGIERYVRTVEAVLTEGGITYQRMNLREGEEGHPSFSKKVAFTREVHARLRRQDRPTRLIIAHRNLLPVAAVAQGAPMHQGTTLICYGKEVWQRWRLPWRRLLRDQVRVLAISGFTSGSLEPSVNATVVPPFLDRAWFGRLVKVGENPTSTNSVELRVLTVFRLEDWQEKGLPALVSAIKALDITVNLVVAGSGVAPPGLQELCRQHPWVMLKSALDDDALSAEYASADVFVLATRTHRGRGAHGEGFGLCLVEAQLAGTVVIAPAFGGSHEAFQAGVTGFAPIDESPQELARVLGLLASDGALRRRMSTAAAQWSRQCFDPDLAGPYLLRALL